MQDIGRDDARMQRRAEGVEPAEREFAVDHRLMPEIAAGAAVFFRHRGAEKPGRTGLVPDLAVVDFLRMPAIDIGHIFGGHEAARLIFQQREVFRHP